MTVIYRYPGTEVWSYLSTFKLPLLLRFVLVAFTLIYRAGPVKGAIVQPGKGRRRRFASCVTWHTTESPVCDHNTFFTEVERVHLLFILGTPLNTVFRTV